MNCDSCGSDRILQICGKVSDRGDYEFKGNVVDGYAPYVENVCDGDYIDPDICLNCGKVQGIFPIVNDPVMGEEEEVEEDSVWSAPTGNGWTTK